MGARAALLLLAALLLCACDGGAAVVPVDTWTASFPGAASEQVRVPARFDRRLPQARTRYVLDTTVRLPLEMQGRPLTLALAHLPAIAAPRRPLGR